MLRWRPSVEHLARKARNKLREAAPNFLAKQDWLKLPMQAYREVEALPVAMLNAEQLEQRDLLLKYLLLLGGALPGGVLEISPLLQAFKSSAAFKSAGKRRTESNRSAQAIKRDKWLRAEAARMRANTDMSTLAIAKKLAQNSKTFEARNFPVVRAEAIRKIISKT